MMSAKDPLELAVIVPDVEDFDIIRTDPVRHSFIKAGLRNPAPCPLVPVRLGRMQIRPERVVHGDVEVIAVCIEEFLPKIGVDRAD